MASDLNIEVADNFYDSVYCEQLLRELLDYKYQDLNLCFHGKSYIPRRKVLAFGDNAVSYAFSGTRISANPWTPTLLDIKKDVETKTGQEYNFVLLNFYPDGYAKIGAHKDDEKDLDPASTIPTLSLGATRTLQFSRKDMPSHPVLLKSGSLLLMKPSTNRLWTHEIPADPSATSPRISLTFRKIVKTSRKRPFDDVSRDDVTSPRVPLPSSDDAIPDNDGLTELYIDETPRPKTSECLKEWNLGYGFIVSLHHLNNRLYVHLRQYDALQQNYYPTTQGVVMNMDTFLDFQNKIFHVNTKYANSSVVCNNQLLIISHKGELVLKQLFYFKLKENFLKVDYNNLIKMREIIPEMCNVIKESLLNTVLPSQILAECGKKVNVPQNIDLVHELFCVLRDEIHANVLKLFQCEGCIIDDPSQFNHDCITLSLEEQCWRVTNDAFLVLNIKNVIHVLQSKNVLQFYTEDFFKSLSYDDLKTKLKL